MKRVLLVFILMSSLVIGILAPVQAHKGHAVVLWDGNYDLYIKCPPDLYAVTKWRMLLGDFTDYTDAQNAGDHSLWIADKNFVETHQPNTITATALPGGGGLIIWAVYSYENHMNFKWTGTKFGDPTTDSISMTDAECRINPPGPNQVPIVP